MAYKKGKKKTKQETDLCQCGTEITLMWAKPIPKKNAKKAV